MDLATPPPAVEPGFARFTVLTVNTHKGFGAFNRRFVLHELREAVRSVGADLVFLQEVMGSHELHRARIGGWPATPHYEFMADEIWSSHAYGRNAVYPHGHHGNAVLSKFPIARHVNHDASVGKSEKRGLLHCVLSLPQSERPLHAVCVHLGLDESHRRAQVLQLCRLVNDGIPPDEPVVVAGDFNDWRCRVDGALEGCAGLQEVFRLATGRPAKTFPARWPVLRLDRIYVRGLQLLRPLVLGRRPWSHLSDHAPLAAELALPVGQAVVRRAA
ncbi:endonuclease/exonuclease/phosphatase family protein [Aquabacterium sp. J223]|uniref:endonuclease/exonuclease/phosphatase family protein n=1 Tax=Aquabacterium sp. J223 TaxID=2898431 RepID=UPI0021AD52C8|nr:endonuclease/exonuclease/phosphatase family protein [Aquabacterium sp. J223]UUX97499.1 endonuclease/exonuclease/phosphatase family protein [Aquabacterium sp. J223]